MTSTGELIKYLRKQKHISADELAEKVGVHRATIFRYERGDIERIPYQVLVPIAEVLGCSPLDLMGIDEAEKEKRLLVSFHSLTPEQQDAVIVMVEGMRNASL